MATSSISLLDSDADNTPLAWDDDLLVSSYSLRPGSLHFSFFGSAEEFEPLIPIQRRHSSLFKVDIPAEIVQNILDLLDLQSATRFSATCVAARKAIENYPPYNDVRTHAPWAARALIGTRLFPHFSMRQLRNTMCSTICTSCQEQGHFGTFVFLPTFERWCYRCLRTNPDARVISRGLAKSLFALRDEDLYGEYTTIPVFKARHALCRSIEGTLALRTRGDESLQSYYRTSLVSVKTARERSFALHGRRKWGYSARKACSYHTTGQCKYLSGDRSAAHWSGKTAPYERPDYLLVPLDNREKVAVPLPFLEKRTGRVHDGMWCYGCARAGRKFPSPTSRMTLQSDLPAYTRGQFLKHARDCPYVLYFERQRLLADRLAALEAAQAQTEADLSAAEQLLAVVQAARSTYKEIAEKRARQADEMEASAATERGDSEEDPENETKPASQ